MNSVCVCVCVCVCVDSMLPLPSPITHHLDILGYFVAPLMRDQKTQLNFSHAECIHSYTVCGCGGVVNFCPTHVPSSPPVNNLGICYISTKSTPFNFSSLLGLSRAELLFSVMEQGLPFRKWNSRTLVAWLEVWVGVPFWYIAAIRNCLDNGEKLSVSNIL